MNKRAILLAVLALMDAGCTTASFIEGPDGRKFRAGPGTSAASIEATTSTAGDTTLEGLLTLSKDIDAQDIDITTRSGSRIKIGRWTSNNGNNTRLVEGLIGGLNSRFSDAAIPAWQAVRESSEQRRVNQQDLRAAQVREREAVALQRAEEAKLATEQAKIRVLLLEQEAAEHE